MMRVSKCNDHGHCVTVKVDVDGTVDANIGTVDVERLPDREHPDQKPIRVACRSCLDEVERLTQVIS